MLNEESLSAALTADALAAGGPPADLLALVRRRAARQQRRKSAALGSLGVLVVAAAVTGGVALRGGGQHATTVLSAAASPTPFCDDPGANVPSLYVDWPCATAADFTTPGLVSTTLKAVLEQHSGIKEPRVRLLADTRMSTDPDTGPSVTVIEVWDAAGTGPAIIATADSQGYAPSGDPAFMVGGALTTGNGVTGLNFYTRADVTSVELDHDGAVTTSTVTGGIASIMVKAGDPGIMHPTWTYVAKNASGATVGTAPFDYPVDADPCEGKVSSTCTTTGGASSDGASTQAPSSAPRSAPVSPGAGAGATQVPSSLPAATQVPSTAPATAAASAPRSAPETGVSEVPSSLPASGATLAPSVSPSS